MKQQTEEDGWIFSTQAVVFTGFAGRYLVRTTKQALHKRQRTKTGKNISYLLQGRGCEK